MRGFKMRLLSCGMLFALVVWAISSGGHALNGQPPEGRAQPGKKGIKDKEKKDERSPLDELLPFQPPEDREHKRRLDAVREYLDVKDTANIEWGKVCGFLQNILDAKSDSFFIVKDAGPDGTFNYRRISVKIEANRIISTFPPEGLQFYQQQQNANAGALLEEAVKANYDIATLSDLSQRYFNTKAGAEGTILLATIHLERGNYIEAAFAFERLLSRKDIEEYTPFTLFKACIALKRGADSKHAELYKATLAKFDAVAKNGLDIKGRKYTLEKLHAEIDRPVELVQKSALVNEWATMRGNASRSAVVEGSAPFLDPQWRAAMFPPDSKENSEANAWIRGELEKLFVRDAKANSKGVPLPGTFPVSTSDLLIYRAYDGITAIHTHDRLVGAQTVRAGTVAWRSKTTAGLHQLISIEDTSDVDMRRDVQSWWARYSSLQANVSSILYENPLIGSLTHDGQNVYFVDDVAVPPPPAFNDPNFGFNTGPQFRQGGDLADMVRAGRLAAVNMKSGSVVWELGRVKPPENDPNVPPPPPLPPRLTEEEADKTTDAFRLCLDAVFLGPPTALNGKLYVLIEQAGCVRLLCLDPKSFVIPPGQTRKPVLLWSQKLGKPNNTLPQDSIRRYQGAIIAAGDGILVCPTNCGVLVAVDTMSRSLLWAHGYRQVDKTPPQPRWNPQTGLPEYPTQLPTDRWRSSGPIISNGRVLVSAYDSNKFECLDLRTGKLLWWINRDSSDLYVGGVVNDRVIVVGKNSIRAYHLTGEDKDTQKPKVAWEPQTISGVPTGHGALSKNAYFVPIRQELAGVNTTPAAEIWAFDVNDGKILSKTAARKRADTAELAKFGLGNLVFQGGMVYAQSPWEVTAYPQLALKIEEMNQLFAKNGKEDPVGLFIRGELQLDDGKLKEAVADFKKAEKNLPRERIPALREKLYIAYTELLRADFNSSESFLKEYEGLCEVTVDASAPPEEKVRADDETKRRKRLHYYLLARGRETQGKLGEAFDHYLALAALGEGKQLLDMPDEPNVKMRPDVWARGRIETMISRAATPAAKKSLEDRVTKEWDKVKGGTDLKALREFVAVFGPFFDSGREAQFKLADLLLSTGNEADAREAQTHLSQLRVTAEDATVRARATEALAQLMIKNRMMEDAVALYLQLGKEYPNVVVRDGKTGADFANRVFTDKRLLPFLEPSRYPLPTRVKAEQRNDPQPGINYGAQFEIESPPDLFPMFRQMRFVLDQYRSGNGSWTLIGFDRTTGNEKMRFPNMLAPNLWSNNGQPIPYSKFVQGNGHIMLVQLGLWVYCFDLAEKKELWSRNLLGDNPPALQPGNPNPPVEVDAEGECTIRYADGYTVTLGRSTVVQPGYVAILTRDGLECVEPQTKRVQWVRKGIADRTQIQGDARYLVLIERDAQKKLAATKLLRAVDGMVVENSKDASRVLADAKSYKFHGRYALLTSGTGDEKRVLRLYDMAEDKDVWKKEFDSKSVVITSPLHTEWTGYVKTDGTVEIMNVLSGKTVASLKLDEKHAADQMKACVGAQLLADADRFYLILDRDPSAGSTNGTRPVLVYNNYMLRSQKVNGPIYAFDRSTHKRLWHYADVMENQWLVLEHFADMPVLIASAPMMRDGNNQQYVHGVVVIEKERGRLLFDKTVVYNGNFFQNLTVDQKNGTISMNRYDTRIYISRDDPKPEK